MVFGTNKCTKEMEKNKKIKQLIKYINQNQLECKIYGEELSPESLICFLHNINSIERAAIALSDFSNIPSIDEEPESAAKFYNVYDSRDFSFPGSYITDLVTDEEYLKFASPQWTKTHILDYSFDRVLSIDEKNNISVRENVLTEENEEVYESSMNINIQQLISAKEKGILKEAIESLD